MPSMMEKMEMAATSRLLSVHDVAMLGLANECGGVTLKSVIRSRFIQELTL